MNHFKLVRHRVIGASFIENKEKEKKNDAEVGVEGSILIPKDIHEAKHLIVQLKVNLGQPDERLYLMLETVSMFAIEKAGNIEEISEEEVRAKCFPVALSELRKTVKKVTEAYGMSAVDLPPFEEELITK